MIKATYFFFTCFLFLNNLCFAQTSPAAKDTLRVIEIISGNSLREKSLDSINKIQTIAGNVLLREGFTKFSCDSAIINQKENTIEAFGNVHINDADTLHTYAQYLKYYGNTRMAFLKRNVKLNDTKGTLQSQDLDYDLKSGIGNYHTGGKVVNGTTVLTSKEGVYYSDTKDVYFKNNVDLTDPKYKIKADSLLYNTLSQRANFIGPTYIKTKEANIYTTQGYYDLQSGSAFFGTRSVVTDSSGRIYQADKIALDEKAGQAELEGNAVIKDSANGVIVTANHIYLNSKNNSFLATNKPVMIIQQEKDSIYISADTLFSGFTTRVSNEPLAEKNDSLKKVLTKAIPLSNDSAQVDSVKIVSPENDSLKIDSIKYAAVNTNALSNNSLKPNLKKNDSINITSLKNDSLKAGATKINPPLHDSSKSISPGNDSIKNNSVQINPQQNDSIHTDTLKGTKMVNLNKTDTSIRYFLAFHHVRIFNDSLQSVCDSLFFSGQDSVFRLFKDPVVWSGKSQVTGDTIYLFTKNKKAERLYVFENGMIANKNDVAFYNQIAGKTVNAYFKNGVIDYARVKGQKAESIYYVQDNDSAYVGMNRATGDVIDMFFLKGELNKVKFVNDVHGVMYPMKHIPADERYLKNFNWLDKRRPKNKLELFE